MSRRPSDLAALPAVLAVLAVLAALLTALAAQPAAAAAQGQAIRGGDLLYATAGSCPVGFNAVRGADSFALVQGRCASGAGSTWYADAARTVAVGVTEGVDFPGSDFAVIRYTNPSFSYPGEINAGGGQVIDITGAAAPFVGQSVCQIGRASGMHCGTVVAVNQTVNYPEGTVYGLFRSNACQEPGDGGGPAFSGGTALGVIAGGSGSCATGGVTYYQPVTEALAAYGLTLP